MSTVVQTNVMALNSHRSLGIVSNMQGRASARLSSGFRINSAADDAAGLAISEKMRAQIRGLDQASRNAQDGSSFLQVADGALSVVNDMLIRVRELTNQAANDTNTGVGSLGGSDRGQIAREIQELQSEIREMSHRTEFNTLAIFDGSLSGGFNERWNAAGTIAGNTVADDVEGQTMVDLIGLQRELADLFGIDTDLFATVVGAQQINSMNSVMTSLAQVSGDGAVTSVQVSNILIAIGVATGTATHSATAGQSMGWDPRDFNNDVAAQEFVDIANHLQRLSNQVFGSTGTVWFQVGANEGQGLEITIDINLDVIAAGLDETHDTIANATNLGGERISNLLTQIDGLLEDINDQRAQLGAWQNRLEFTIENLDLTSENLSAANSRIRDADMAQEMMRFTQSNVLQQAAISMLSQANQAPQSILQLLR